MNLRELRAYYPDLFYQRPVAWWDKEPFASRHIGEPPTTPRFEESRSALQASPLAVSLAWAFVLDPTAEVWDHWFWCADKDRDGQRVYVGRRGGLWEIHRHLALTERWGIALWG